MVVSDSSAERLPLAAALLLGADHTVDLCATTSAPPSGSGPADAADAVIECSGHPGLINEAMQLAAVDGRVTVVGMCMKPDTVLPWSGCPRSSTCAS